MLEGLGVVLLILGGVLLLGCLVMISSSEFNPIQLLVLFIAVAFVGISPFMLASGEMRTVFDSWETNSQEYSMNAEEIVLEETPLHEGYYEFEVMVEDELGNEVERSLYVKKEKVKKMESKEYKIEYRKFNKDTVEEMSFSVDSESWEDELIGYDNGRMIGFPYFDVSVKVPEK